MSTYRDNGSGSRQDYNSSNEQGYEQEYRPLTPRQKAEQRSRRAQQDAGAQPVSHRNSQRIVSERDQRYRSLGASDARAASDQAAYGDLPQASQRSGARVQVSSPFTRNTGSTSGGTTRRSVQGQQRSSQGSRYSGSTRTGAAQPRSAQSAQAQQGTQARTRRSASAGQTPAGQASARQRGAQDRSQGAVRSQGGSAPRGERPRTVSGARGSNRQPQTTPRATTGGDARSRANGNYMRTDKQNKIRREFRAQRFLMRTLPVLLVAAVVVFGVFQWANHRPITVYVNDTKVELRGDRTAEHAVQMSGVKVTPGNLLDVEGQVLTEGGGTPYTLTVDGEMLDDATQDLHSGDKVAVSDGVDVEEDSVTQENGKLPNQTREEGIGPIHAIQPGQQGIGTIKTGKVSGKVVVISVEQEPTDTVYLRYFPNVGDDKVVALTFDDGPVTSNGQTEELLDVLKDNGAKATFFTIGNQIEGAGVDAVIRMHEEGHQVCTHTWDHAAGSGQGVNLSYMTPEEQRDEIEKGINAIATAIGEEPSRAMRAPGGNFPIEVWENLDDLITADIGWNIDTMDWSQPGSSYIAEQIKSAKPGDIILMHDGGGDRSQTIEALREALPYLREQGYQFITIDELLQYPPHEDNGQAPAA